MVLKAWKSKPLLKLGILLLIYPIGSTHGLKTRQEEIAWPGLKPKQKLVFTKSRKRYLGRRRQMKGGESAKRCSGFLWFIIIIFFVNFLPVNTFFLILASIFRLYISFISYHFLIVTWWHASILEYAFLKAKRAPNYVCKFTIVRNCLSAKPIGYKTQRHQSVWCRGEVSIGSRTTWRKDNHQDCPVGGE